MGQSQKFIVKPKVMGILNVTPDSFSDGGKYLEQNKAIEHALSMVEQGVDIIDVGGESSRPGAKPVPLKVELDRVLPIISAIRQQSSIPISIDTQKAKVMQQAVAAGANFINDINALQGKGALQAAAKLNVPVCLMHMKGSPKTMQNKPKYADVISEITQFFQQRIQQCLAAGIKAENICIDPGFGFGKRVCDNLKIIRELKEFKVLHKPIIVGVSRKSTIGEILNLPESERLYGSLALTSLAILNGANIIRTHDVKPTRDLIDMTLAVYS